MRYSFRMKLNFVISSLILFFIIMSIFLNNTFLEKYYIARKESILKDTFNNINTLYNSNGDVDLELEKIERLNGIQIVVADKNFSMIYDFLLNRRDDEKGPSPNMKEAIENNQAYFRNRSAEILSKRMILGRRDDRRLKTSFISLTGVADNGNYILLTMPVAAIQENASVANDFFLFTGIITLIFGVFFLNIMTKKLTDPIVELNNIAQKMSLLDFSRKYMGRSQDEIGELGDSINSLSEKLEATISELVKANKKLLSDIEYERKVDNTRKEFISNVSHELKTPIALIQGYAEGLMVNINEDEENKNFYCEVIIDEAAKMNRLVKELLELSIIESGQANFEASIFGLSQLLSLVVKKDMLLLKEKGVVPEVLVPEEININADYDKIERVLVNYLNNAINHVDEKAVIRLIVTKKGNKARIVVYNSGKHIPKESLEKIWASFYKVDKARTREYGGTGLGLSIVSALLEMHGYKYGVNNVEGGVEFWFEADIYE